MPGVKLTYEDLVRMPDDGLRHELIDGEHYVTPAPSIAHQVVKTNLIVRLGMHLVAHPVGVVVTEPNVVRGKSTKLQPDVVYMSKRRAREVRKPLFIDGAPELVIEVSSPSTWQYDLTVKHKAYARLDVLEYWFIDVETRTVSIHRLSPVKKEFVGPVLIHGVDAHVSTPLLPGFQLALSDLFNQHDD